MERRKSRKTEEERGNKSKEKGRRSRLGGEDPSIGDPKDGTGLGEETEWRQIDGNSFFQGAKMGH